jgi:putative ABC transport system permease protein
MKPLFRKTIRDLWQQRGQSIALISLAALGVISFVGMIAAFRNLNVSYNYTYDTLHFADVTFYVQNAPEDLADQIAAMDGVSAASGRLEIDTGLKLPDDAAYHAGETIRARLIGMNGLDPGVNDLMLLDGAYPSQDQRDGILLETHFAENYGYGPGTVLKPRINGKKKALTITGVVASPEYLVVTADRQNVLPQPRSFAVMFVPLDELQRLANTGRQINSISVLLAPTNNPEAVIQSIKDQLKPYGLLATIKRADQPSHALLQMDLDGYRQMSAIMPVMILGVASGAIYVLLGRQVRAQQTQIGLMKALGYSDRAVVLHFISYALFIGGAGAVLGVLLGIPIGRGITSEYATELGIPLVQSHFYPDTVIISLALSLFMTGLAGLFPALKSAQIVPAQAMRQTPSEALMKGHHLPLERVMPLWLRVVLRNMIRIPRRTLTTAMGMLVSYVLVLASFGFLDTMNVMLDHQFNDIQKWDAMIGFDQQEQYQQVVVDVRDLGGVTQVEPILQLPAVLKLPNKDIEIGVTGLNPNEDMQRLLIAAPVEQALTPDHIVLTEAIASANNIQVGDPLVVEVKDIDRHVTVSGITSEFAGAVAYVSMDQAQRWTDTHSPVYTGAYLRLRSGTDLSKLREDLYDLPGLASVSYKTELRQQWDDLMGLFYAFIGVFTMVGLAVSFVLLYNAVTVNVVEQEGEFATLRSFGTGVGRIVRQVLLDFGILWVLLTIPGMVLGTYTTVQLGKTFGADLFAFPVVIKPLSYLWTALGILATILLVGLPTLRRIKHIDLVEATKRML